MENEPKKSKKYLAIIVVIIVLGLLYLGYILSPLSEKPEPIDREGITTLTIYDENLPEEIVERYKLNFEKAKEEYLKDPDSIAAVRPLIDISSIKELSGDYEGAKNAIRAALEIDPESTVLNGIAGNLYYHFLNDYEKAEEHYLLAVAKISPTLYTYYIDLYNIYKTEYNDINRAEAILVQALEKIPDSDSQKINMYAKAAAHFKEKGEIEQARFFYNVMLEINPDSQVAADGLESLNQ